MNGDPSAETVVLVAGAGPVGLTMACELLRHGVPCRIIEQNDGPTPLAQSRALGIQARTLESLENVGATERILGLGRKIHGMSAFHAGQRFVHLKFDLDALDTPYPFVTILPQAQTERTLLDVLQSRGGAVEWHTALTGFETDGQVRATIRGPDGAERTVHSRWLIGCDDSRSIVRHKLNLSYQRTDYPESFYLADVRIDWDQPDDEVLFVLSTDVQLGAFPLPEPHRWRLVDPSGAVGTDDPLKAAERFQSLLRENGFPGVRVSDPVWASSFRIHRRVVDNFRVGSCLVAGDAAHIRSPAGGQGMNTGIQEACNLAWKLGLIHAGAARDPEGLLDSYGAERAPIARDVLHGTDQATRTVDARSPVLEAIRNRVASFLSELDSVPQQISMGLSELGVNYRESPIVAEDLHGIASLHDFPGPHAGDRVPDVPLDAALNGGAARLF
jgi:2-polyprenyl-6-methoxyphenol hydroxylase-like FAD-dependent oxidoreductase